MKSFAVLASILAVAAAMPQGITGTVTGAVGANGSGTSGSPLSAIAGAIAGATVDLCAGSTGSPKCCATDVLGVADLNCVTPPGKPLDSASFKQACSTIGQQAKCCALPILGQGLVCSNPA